MKKIVLLSFVGCLSGCQSIQGLTEKPGALTAPEQEVAVKIQEATVQKCIIVRGHDIPGIKPHASGKFWDKPIILKLYSSSTNFWWKADVLYNSVWDSIYLNKFTQAVVCGDKQWASSKYSSETVFSLVAPK